MNKNTLGCRGVFGVVVGLGVGMGVAGQACGQGGGSHEAIWENNCAKCHGANGEGGGGGTRSLLTREARDAVKGIEVDRRYFDAIKGGLPDSGMDAFGVSLSDAQIWSTVVYIREMQERSRREDGEANAFGKDGENAGSGGSGKGGGKGKIVASKYAYYTVSDVVKGGLDTPWSVDWLIKDGEPTRMLVTNRSGELGVYSWELDEKGGGDGGLKVAKIADVSGMPAVRNRGQGGLMDVAPHPEFAKNGWVYLAFSDELKVDGKSQGMTKIVRGKINEKNEWVEQQTVFEARPEHYLRTDLHFGCRIVFGAVDEKTGKHEVFFGIGERGMGDMAQDLTRPNGKIHRVWDDGTIPTDNPFVSESWKEKKYYPSIWSFGHRNPQGLVMTPEGVLWDTEHGPRGGDEVNVIQKSANYGWPMVSFGINYSAAPLKSPWPDASVEGEGEKRTGVKGPITMPVFRWLPSIGACGLDVMRPGVKGDAFPMWKGDLLAGGLSGANVDRIRVVKGESGWSVVEREEIVHGMGRVRDVVTGPEGAVYVVLNGPDKVVRVMVAKGEEKKAEGEKKDGEKKAE